MALFSIAAMQRGDEKSCIELVKGLHNCAPNLKAMNLRALVSSKQLSRAVLSSPAGDLVLSWLEGKNTGLARAEELRLTATIMKIQGNTEWYDPTDKGKSLTPNEEPLLSPSVYTIKV